MEPRSAHKHFLGCQVFIHLQFFTLKLITTILKMYLETNSSQVLFSISQKLIQHQIVNYTDILRWLREVLTCRNSFLLRHRDYANVGSQVSVAKQAHIKLEVIFLLIKTIYFSIVWLTFFFVRWYFSSTYGVLIWMPFLFR